MAITQLNASPRGETDDPRRGNSRRQRPGPCTHKARSLPRDGGGEAKWGRDKLREGQEREGGGVEVDAEEQSSLERPDGVPDGGRGTCSILPRTPLPRLSRAVFRGARFLPQEVLSSERREAPPSPRAPPRPPQGHPKHTRIPGTARKHARHPGSAPGGERSPEATRPPSGTLARIRRRNMREKQGHDTLTASVPPSRRPSRA